MQNIETYESRLRAARQAHNRESARLFRQQVEVHWAHYLKGVHDLIQPFSVDIDQNYLQALSRTYYPLVSKAELVTGIESAVNSTNQLINRLVQNASLSLFDQSYTKQTGKDIIKQNALGKHFYQHIFKESPTSLVTYIPHPLAICLIMSESDYTRRHPHLSRSGAIFHAVEAPDPSSSNQIIIPFINIKSSADPALILHETTHAFIRVAIRTILTNALFKHIWGGDKLKSPDNPIASKQELIEFGHSVFVPAALSQLKNEAVTKMINIQPLDDLVDPDGYNYFKTWTDATLGIDIDTELKDLLPAAIKQFWQEYQQIITPHLNIVNDYYEKLDPKFLELMPYLLLQWPLNQWQERLKHDFPLTDLEQVDIKEAADQAVAYAKHLHMTLYVARTISGKYIKKPFTHPRLPNIPRAHYRQINDIYHRLIESIRPFQNIRMNRYFIRHKRLKREIIKIYRTIEILKDEANEALGSNVFDHIYDLITPEDLNYADTRLIGTYIGWYRKIFLPQLNDRHNS